MVINDKNGDYLKCVLRRNRRKPIETIGNAVHHILPTNHGSINRYLIKF